MSTKRLWMVGLLWLSAASVQAAGVLLTPAIPETTPGGETVYFRNAVRWATNTVYVQVEGGSLGTLSEAESREFVETALGLWNDVESARLTIQVTGGSLPSIDGTNFTTYFTAHEATANVIVFDDDGEIMRALGLDPNHLLGFSAEMSSTESGDILSAYNVINGAVMAASPPLSTSSEVQATMVHEMGHFVGLDHSQLNGHLAFNGHAGDDVYTPIMFPFAGDDDAQRVSLHFDDEQALAMNYPVGTFGVPKIHGTILSGTNTQVLGANVVARNVEDRNGIVTSMISDHLFLRNGTSFLFSDLPLGDYEIYIEPVDTRFLVKTSTVGPYSDLRFGSGLTESDIEKIYAGNKGTAVYAEFFDGKALYAGDLVASVTDEQEIPPDDRVTVVPVRLEEGRTFAFVDMLVPMDEPPEIENGAHLCALGVPEFGGIGGLPAGVTGGVMLSPDAFMFEVLPRDLAMRVALKSGNAQPLTLYAANEIVPDGNNIDAQFVARAFPDAAGNATIQFSSFTEPFLEEGTYFFAAGNGTNDDVDFTIQVTKENIVPRGIPIFMETVLAGLNADAMVDKIANSGPAGSFSARIEGNLVGEPEAALFQHSIYDSTSQIVSVAPIYDASRVGSLIQYNLEIGDPLVLAAQVRNMTPDVVVALSEAVPGSAERQELVDELVPAVYAQWLSPASVGLVTAVTGERFLPTDVVAVPQIQGGSDEVLTFVWDGRELDWWVGDPVSSVSNVLEDLVVVTSEVVPFLNDIANGVAVDVYGPTISESILGVPIQPDLVAAWRLGDDLQIVELAYPRGVTETEIPFEFIPGDILAVTALITARAELDGEERLEGDRLSLGDVNFDFSTLGGDALSGSDPGQPLKGESFVTPVTDAFQILNEESYAGTQIVLGTGVLGDRMTGLSSGDYSVFPIVFSVADDVIDPISTFMTIRYDDIPLKVVDVVFDVAREELVNLVGESRPRLLPDDEMTVIATIDLQGDPFEAGLVPQVTADLTAFDPLLTAMPPDEILDLGNGQARVSFSLIVSASAPPSLAGEAIFHTVDDAGNRATDRSGDLGAYAVVGYGIPIMRRAAVAGLNADATPDALQRYGAPGTLEAIAEGNLVGATHAELFVEPADEPSRENRLPLYDENLPGSLLNGNVEIGDELLVGVEVRNVTPDIVAALKASVPGSATRIVIEQALLADVYLVLDATSFGMGMDVPSGEPVFPHAVLPVAGDIFPATESLIYVWEGIREATPWVVGENPASSTSPVDVASIFASQAPDDQTFLADPLGIDILGPRWGDSSLSAVERAIGDRQADLDVTAGTDGTALQELIAGDLVTIEAILDTRSEHDGEAAVHGDPVPLNDISTDFGDIGGLTGSTGERFSGLVVANSMDAVAGTVVYQVSEWVYLFDPPVTTGDYDYATIVISATDDVLSSTETFVTVRLDTVPAVVTGTLTSNSRGELPDASGTLVAGLGDTILVTATVDLQGDPFDAESRPTVTLNARPFDYFATMVEPISLVEIAPGIAQAVFEVTVTESARQALAAGVVVWVTDDAGNLNLGHTSSFGLWYDVQGRTGFDLVDGEVIAAALNEDAPDDLLARLGAPGSESLRLNGDLVTTPESALFNRVVDDPGAGNVEPLHDPATIGSLIDRNLEIGDTLVAAAVVTNVTAELVEQIRSFPVDSPEYAAAAADAARHIAAFLDTSTDIQFGAFDPTQAVFPTDVTGTALDHPHSATSLVFVWDGAKLEPPLFVTDDSVSTNPVVILRLVPTDVEVDLSQRATPLGLDVDGPDWIYADGAAEEIAVLSARRPPQVALGNDALDLLDADGSVPVDLEFIPGDTLILSALLDPNAFLSGESLVSPGATTSVATRYFGAGSVGPDALTLADIFANLSEVGATGPLTDESVQERALIDLEGTLTDVSGLPLDASFAYQVEAVLGGYGSVPTTGDFEIAELLFVAADDVNVPVTTSVRVRYDDRSLLLTDLEYRTERGDTVDFLGETRPRLLPGEAIDIVLTLDLQGDSFDADASGRVWDVTADLSAFSSGRTEEKPSDVLDLGGGIVMATYSLTVADNAAVTTDADAVFVLTDDAGNTTVHQAADFDLLAVVGHGVPLVSRAVVAVLNDDAIDDALERFGADGTPEAIAAGNLVGSDDAILFVTPTADAANGNRAPLYEPNQPGSLLSANAETGDRILVGAQIANVTPSLVAQLAAAVPGTPEFAAVEAQLLPTVSPILSATGFGSPAVLSRFPVSPHVVLPVLGSDGSTADSVIFVWDGSLEAVPWVVGEQPASNTDPVEIAYLYPTGSADGAFRVTTATPLGMDTQGPEWIDAAVGSVQRTVGVQMVDLDLSADQDGVPLQELIVGDLLTFEANIETHATEDGELAEDGDALTLVNMGVDFSPFGGSADGQDEHFAGSATEIVSSTAIYRASERVGSAEPPVTSGDFDLVTLVAQALDDVIAPVLTQVSVRLDTVPAIVTGVTASTSLGEFPNATGTLQVGSGDIVIVTATIDLGGDPFDAESRPEIVLDATAFDLFTDAILPVTFVSLQPDTAVAIFEVTVAEMAIPDDAAHVTLTVEDDAGNVTVSQSGEFDLLFSVVVPPLGDFNGDGLVNYLDVIIFSGFWQEGVTPPLDLLDLVKDPDNAINREDLLLLWEILMSGG